MGSIQGEIVTLRALHASFFDAYLAMFSGTIQQILHVPDLYCEEQYLRQRIAKIEQGTTFFYCMFVAQQLIGALEIRDRAEHRGQLYSWVHEHFWGKGHYQEGLSLLCSSYFARTHADYFTAHVDVSNLRSMHALRKGGFAHAGLQPGGHGMQYVMWRRRL